MVRWREGQLSPIGPQSLIYNNLVFASRCKAIHGWYDLAEVYHIAYLCEQHIYVDTGGVLVDITPASGQTNVVYGGATAYGVDAYSGDITYGLTPPSPYGTVGGYSDGAYGAEAYGTTRSASTIIPLDTLPDAWSLDNFGAILYAMSSADGRLLMWDPAVGGRAIEVASADTGTGFAPRGRCFVVTQERFIQIFGCTRDGTTGGGSFRRFAWCDQENFHAWNFSNVTSQAGFLDIEPGEPDHCGCLAMRTGTLFWTGKKAYVSPLSRHSLRLQLRRARRQLHTMVA